MHSHRNPRPSYNVQDLRLWPTAKSGHCIRRSGQNIEGVATLIEGVGPQSNIINFLNVLLLFLFDLLYMQMLNIGDEDGCSHPWDWNL